MSKRKAPMFWWWPCAPCTECSVLSCALSLQEEKSISCLDIHRFFQNLVMEQPSGSAAASKTSRNTKQNRNPSKDHTFRKRRPQKPEEGDFIIYVSTKTNTNALLEKCNKLINSGENEIIIYCLGAAIQRGIVLALRASEQNPTFKISTNTYSTELLDDLEPAADDADYQLQRRCNSALKICLLRQDMLSGGSTKTT